MDTEAEGSTGNATHDGDASARRDFLLKAGKYAAVTPPLVATMLAVTSTPALANGSGASSGSGGQGRSNGRGHGGANSHGKALGDGNGHGNGNAHGGAQSNGAGMATETAGSQEGVVNCDPETISDTANRPVQPSENCVTSETDRAAARMVVPELPSKSG
jgi:hypothetical protein